MGEEKVRVSGELSKPDNSPILPTVNPLSEKSEPPKSALHPAAYVMSVLIQDPTHAEAQAETE